MFTHVGFIRPSTDSKLVIEAPFEFSMNAHEDERFVEWVMKDFPDWIPWKYLRRKEDEERADSVD